MSPQPSSFHEPEARAPNTDITRRIFAGGAWLSGSCALIRPNLARASDKVPQREAGYQNSPKGGAKCEACQQFLPPSGCKLVNGPISPSGWCNFFAPRAH